MVTPNLSPSPPPSIPDSNSTKHKEKKKRMENIIIYIARFAPSSSLPFSPDPCHLTFPLLVPDGIVFLATPDVQLHRPEERADCARDFLVRMRDPPLFYQSVTPPESWP